MIGRTMLGTAQRDRLFLLDGMALAYRAYFALIARPLTNSKGENTSAIYGFVTALMKILAEERPEYLAVVFDARGPTFRHRMYSEYKATRQKMPEEMAGQMDKLKETVRAFNTPLLEVPGFEADDVIGTLARKAERENVHTYMVTGDKDFMQLISPLISIYKPGKGGSDAELIDQASVATKFGVPPDRVIDVLGLMGDTSDNVPGVPGIGPKTAIPLVQKYGSIPQLYEQLENIPQKGVREKLRQNRESAFLSRELVTINTSVPLEVDFRSLRSDKPDRERLTRLFNELEFRTLINRIPSSPSFKETPPGRPPSEESQEPVSSIGTDPHEYSCITTREDLESLRAHLDGASVLAIHAMTTSENPMNGELIGIGFSVEPNKAFFIPFVGNAPGPPGAGWDRINIRGDEVLETVRPVLGNPFISKVGHNLKAVILALKRRDIELQGTLFDTAVASYVTRSDGRHDLASLSKEHLSVGLMAFETLQGPEDGGGHLTNIDLDLLTDYCAQRADINLRIAAKQRELLSEQGNRTLCKEIEFPLVPVLARMEYAGIRLDVGHLTGMSVELEGQITTLNGEIHKMAGGEFNINSTQQLAEVLFEKLGLRTIRKTKTGFSTDAGVLEALRNEHPIVERLLEYRMLTKLKSTYVDALPRLVNPKTGRIHTSFDQTVAATGRLASNDPNLQNIPIRTETGRLIRKAFVPEDGRFLLLSADYSQIELRVMAHICEDPGLTEAFRNNEDIHTTTAARVFGVPPKDVQPEMRRKAKEVNFGIMYGLSPFGLSTRLEIPQSEAKEIIQNYFLRFPRVREYIQTTIASARTLGYVATLAGRRRYLPEINSRNGNVRSNAERQAINMPIQGTAADMIKKAMITIDAELRKRRLRSQMLLQVHDELLFEVPESEVGEVKEIVLVRMKEALPLSVPVEVEVGTGKNWLEAH